MREPGRLLMNIRQGSSSLRSRAASLGRSSAMVLALVSAGGAAYAQDDSEGGARAAGEQAGRERDQAGRRLPPALHRGPGLLSYYVLRQNEDYRKPSTRPASDPFSPLKYVPLGGNPDVYVTFSGEERVQFNSVDRPALGLANPPSTGNYDIQFRHQYGADLHLGQNVRVFGQLVSGQITGHDYVSPALNRQKNALELQQMFVEVGGDVLGGHGGMIAGRQQLHFGSGVLFSPQPRQNIQRNFDGVRAYYTRPGLRIDAIALRPIEWDTGAFDDSTDKTTSIWGVYAAYALPRTQNVRLNLDGFYFNYRDSGSALLQGGASVERRDVFGGRVWGRVTDWRVDATIVGQTGTVRDRDIEAWGAYASATRAVSLAGQASQLRLVADVASGGDRKDGIVRTYNPLYSNQRHSTFGNSLGLTNFYDVGAGLTTPLNDSVELITNARAFWRYSEDDGYGLGFGTVTRTRGVEGRYIGVMPQIGARWTVNPHVQLLGNYSYLITSDGYKAGGQDNMTSVRLELSFMW